MGNRLRIIQLSDCHLRADSSRPYRGIDAAASLDLVWELAKRWKPDVVLLTGDLREDDSGVVYERLAGMFGDEFPVLALPGNHDDPSLMKKWFPAGPWNGVFVQRYGDWQIVLLDSTEPGRVEGVLGDDTVESLAELISSSEAAYALLALHHQPVPVDSPWIDRYPLSRPELFLRLVDTEPRIRCVVWGHIHQEFSDNRGSAMLLGGPSTAANTVPGTRSFVHDGRGPACRWLILQPHGEVESGVLYGGSARVA